jgi:hypothetical protein
MLKIHKSIVLDESQKPIAVQIPIKEFEQIEEIVVNYGLSKLIDEVSYDEQFSVKDAKNDYQSLEQNVGG